MRSGAVIVTLVAMTVAASAQTDVSARVADHRYQTIEVMSEGGAHCTLHREGKMLGHVAVALGARLGLEAISVDITESNADILVACSLNGVAKAMLARWGRTVTIYDGPPCQTADGPNCRSAWAGADWRYPEIVRVLFHPPPTPRRAFVSVLVYSSEGTVRATADLELMKAYGADASTAHELTGDQRTTLNALAYSLLENTSAQMPCPGDDKEKIEIVVDRTTYPFRVGKLCRSPDTKAMIDLMLCAGSPGEHICTR